MQTLELTLTGSPAALEAATADLGTAMAEIAPAGTLGPEGLAVSTPVTRPESARRSVDPLALAALVVAIPGTVLAVWDLTERIRARIEARRRAKALIEAAVRIRIEHRVEVTVATIDGPRTLTDLDPDALLALLDPDRGPD